MKYLKLEALTVWLWCAKLFHVLLLAWVMAWHASAQAVVAEPLVWYTTKAAALAAANSQNKWILLVAGRDTCSNTDYTRNILMTQQSNSAILNQYYVLWYSSVDQSMEWQTYAGGLGSIYLPLVAVIDPANNSAYLDRTTGIPDQQSFTSWLTKYLTASLGVNATGNGSVSSTPSGIACGSTCSASFAIGTSVTLTAITASGSTFIGWGGACSGTTSTCTVSMSTAASVTANFTSTSGTINYPLTLTTGWNLLGNGLNQTITAATLFSDENLVTSVWKWVPAQGVWQFYSPSLDATTLQNYATSQGYGVLQTINAGEGYWVNAKTSGTLPTQSGTAFNLGAANLVSGWNLVATGNNVTPSAFNISLGTSPPGTGTVPSNLTSLWAWDTAQSKWYFYAPSLEAQGGTALADYLSSRGYLDFTQHNKILGNGTGLWVNRP